MIFLQKNTKDLLIIVHLCQLLGRIYNKTRNK
jgi:hypothetical protein